jgi:hypothetical protein
MMNPNKILGVREKDSRTFYKMDLALEKNENNYQNNLENSQKFRKWIFLFKKIFTTQN